MEKVWVMEEKEMNQKFVFVYGSLLNKQKARKVVSEESLNSAIPAVLKGYKRVYNKWSTRRKGYVLNIEKSRGHSVLGLLIGPLSKDELENIRKRELWGKHYECVSVTVQTLLNDKKEVRALTSIAKKRFLIKGKRISLDYEKIVRKGIKDLSIKFKMPEFIENYIHDTFDFEGQKIVS